jgi:hypothetical protein
MREWLAKALAAYVLHTPIPWGRGKLGKLAWWMYPYPILVKNEDGFSVKVKMNDPYDRWVNGRCPEPHFERHVFGFVFATGDDRHYRGVLHRVAAKESNGTTSTIPGSGVYLPRRR